MYNAGLRVYMLDNYNWIDYIVLSVYLSSYVLRILVQQRIKIADRWYNGTARAREALLQHDVSLYENIRDEIFRDGEQPAYSYFMKACTSSIADVHALFVFRLGTAPRALRTLFFLLFGLLLSDFQISIY